MYDNGLPFGRTVSSGPVARWEGGLPLGILDGDVRIFIKAYIRGIPRGLNKAVEAPQSFLLTFNNSKVDLL